jgi:quercetin dioxygenase-like cupin family protein
MNARTDFDLTPALLPGIAHRTLAGPEHGMKGFEVWMQSLDAGAATPPHRHDCEEVVVVLEGEVTMHLDGRAKRFAAGETLIVPPDAEHQLVNSGESPLRIMAVFGMAPVRATFPDGTPIALPWAPDAVGKPS